MNERETNKPNPLKDKSFQFALMIIQFYKFLTEEKREYIMSKQLLRSGTSIGANIREGQNAQSKADFIHKLSISQKECDETLYWLELLHQSGFLEEKEFKTIHNDANELLKMLRSSILTTKQNMHNS
ncbi:MAG: four helix bundle protein [Bacteroidetes bacterium]|nr:four helix bundle protein [Bacteroidota bacterium]